MKTKELDYELKKDEEGFCVWIPDAEICAYCIGEGKTEYEALADAVMHLMGTAVKITKELNEANHENHHLPNL